MRKLLKSYGFQTESEYFEMICESVLNGQRSQAKEQFKALPKVSQKEFIKSSVLREFGLSESDKNMFIDAL